MKKYLLLIIFINALFCEVSLASEAGFIRNTKAGMDISIDSKLWKISGSSTARLANQLNLDQIFLPINQSQKIQLEAWRGIKVDFENRNQENKTCPKVNANSLPKINGFECFYREKSNGREFLFAVKKVIKSIRSPSSKKGKIEFTRFVTFIEQSPKSIEDFKNWISKSKEIP